MNYDPFMALRTWVSLSVQWGSLLEHFGKILGGKRTADVLGRECEENLITGSRASDHGGCQDGAGLQLRLLCQFHTSRTPSKFFELDVELCSYGYRTKNNNKKRQVGTGFNL